MRLSLFYVALLLLAAGSEARSRRRGGRLVKNKRDACTKRGTLPSSIVSAVESIPTSSTTDAIIEHDVVGQPAANNSLTSAAAAGQGKCAGFRNVVFNTAAPQNPGFPTTTWNSLVANGVDGWRGFSLGPLNMTPTYAWPPNKKYDSDMDAHQYHVVMDGSYVAAAKDMLLHNPPTYMELYNEPDLSFEGYTKVTDPETAWTQLKPLFDMRPAGTTFIAPSAVTQDWLQKFHTACTNATYDCFSDLPILSPHIYNSDPDGVISAIKSWKAVAPTTTKEVWIGELSPATSGCTLDQAGIIDFMQKVVNKIFDPTEGVTYVKKIFWNCGEHGGSDTGLAGGTCNPSLTNDDGSANAILDAYHTVCDNVVPPNQAITS